ncbi:MAG: flagellin, partial [Planctomycetota bacterium]
SLLDGTAGINGSADNPNTAGAVTFIKGDSRTTAGTYAVDVTTAAERANITASAATTTLAADEVLTLNGVSITLSQGLTQTGVINRINEFTSQTGVVAEDDPGSAGSTRLRSIEFGTDATIEVVSDTAAAATSSGFGTTTLTDTGVNVVGTIDSAAASGRGNVLTSTEGAADGTVIQLAADAADLALSYATASSGGGLGNVTVRDDSLTFQIGANQNQTAELAINSVAADKLGIGVTGSRFSSLDEIDITSAEKAQEALAVIDAAIDEISGIRGELGAFQANTLESLASNMRTTLENTVNAESVIRDTDFAEEISNFTNKQILVQAGTSVLSSANQTSQSILSLLQ